MKTILAIAAVVVFFSFILNQLSSSSDAAYKSCVEAGVQSNDTCKFYVYR